jgi:hypothetical protein
MRVMALDTFIATFVPSIFNTHEFAASTIGVIEKCMASQAKLSGRIQGKKFLVVRMIDGRTMAIFAFDRRVTGGVQSGYILFMSFNTCFPARVFNRKIFPLLDIAQSVITVGEVPSVNSKILWNQKLSGYENQTDQTQCHP